MIEGLSMPISLMAVVGFKAGSSAMRRAICRNKVESSMPVPFGRPRRRGAVSVLRSAIALYLAATKRPRDQLRERGLRSMLEIIFQRGAESRAIGGVGSSTPSVRDFNLFG